MLCGSWTYGVQVATAVAMAKPPHPPPPRFCNLCFQEGQAESSGLFFSPSDLGKRDEACACTSCVILDKRVSLSGRQGQRFSQGKSRTWDPSPCR